MLPAYRLGILFAGVLRRAHLRDFASPRQSRQDKIELSKSSHLLKTAIFEDDKLRIVDFLVAILERICMTPPKYSIRQKS